MGDGTPVLRADATDDDLGLDDPGIAGSGGEPAESGDTVETPEPPKRQVPVVIGGVLHGYREET